MNRTTQQALFGRSHAPAPDSGNREGVVHRDARRGRDGICIVALSPPRQALPGLLRRRNRQTLRALGNHSACLAAARASARRWLAPSRSGTRKLRRFDGKPARLRRKRPGFAFLVRRRARRCACLTVQCLSRCACSAGAGARASTACAPASELQGADATFTSVRRPAAPTGVAGRHRFLHRIARSRKGRQARAGRV